MNRMTICGSLSRNDAQPPGADQSWIDVLAHRFCAVGWMREESRREDETGEGEGASRKVFARTTSTVNVSILAEGERPLARWMPIAVEVLPSAKRLLQLCLEVSNHGTFLGAELVEFQGHLLAAAVAMGPPTDEFIATLDAADPTYPVLRRLPPYGVSAE